MQFYESDLFLLQSIGQFVMSTLTRGEGCIVACSAMHSTDLHQYLQSQHFDTATHLADGRYISIDAETALARFMVQSSPDAALFTEWMTRTLETASANSSRPVRIFGEMVAVLWQDGNYSAALRLEELWNKLQKISTFSLYCAYPMKNLGGAKLASSLLDVCTKHSRVVPAESYTALQHPQDKLRAIIMMQQKAQSLELEIAERKEAEIKLRASEMRYRRLFEASRDGLLILDADSCRIIDANFAACELLGMQSMDLIQKELWETGLLQNPAENISMLRKLRDSQIFHEPHLIVRNRLGQIKNIEIVAGMYEANHRKVIQCNIRDITKRVTAEHGLRSAKEELERLHFQLQKQLTERERVLAREQAARLEAETVSRIKDEFLATVSHELRTPLNSMLGWTRMLKAPHLDPQLLSRAVSNIEQGVKVQTQLIEDLLDVSCIISGKLKLDITSIKLASVIDGAIETVRPAADAKNIVIDFRFDFPQGAVFGDASRLQQVIWNLLSNAIKFTPKLGRLWITLSRSESSVEIKVADNGEGISPEFLPFVFDRFRQADGTTTRQHGGLGLGLAIVRHLVELHGGTVEVDSAGVGHGATFIVKLPRRATEIDPIQDVSGGLERIV